MSLPSTAAGNVFDLEFRCADDDAWYSVRSILSGDTLTIQFENFPEISFSTADFDSIDEVDEFTRRIRPVSTQLQDHECYKINQGMRVCACSSWREDDLRYYDAFVEAIEYKDHLLEKAEEECLCTFVLSWLHGPNAAMSYLQMDEDRDIGGVPFNMNKIEEPGNQYYILIDNLEKDLSPRSIVEFIHRQTSVTAEAYVFPSLLAESYARGAIVLDSKRSLEEIYEFLINPDHAIISSTGRPWVITEEKMRRGYFKTVGSLMPKSQSGILEDKLKLVHVGTEEYRKAARLKNLFKDFIDHQRQLHERLTLEHNKNLCPSAS